MARQMLFVPTMKTLGSAVLAILLGAAVLSFARPGHRAPAPAATPTVVTATVATPVVVASR